MIKLNKLSRLTDPRARGAALTTGCLIIVIGLTVGLLLAQNFAAPRSVGVVADDKAARAIDLLIKSLVICISLIGIAFLSGAEARRGRSSSALRRDVPRLHSELERYKREYRQARMTIVALQDQVLRAREEERREISRELHDSTLNHLAAASLSLMRLNTALPASGEARGVLDQAKGSLQLAAKELRAMTYLMHPPALEAAGLRMTAEQFIGGFSQRTGIRVHLRLRGALDALPFDVQCCAFRVLQEALSNVHRHANANAVRIFLAAGPGSFVLMVSDNGQGFPYSPSAAPLRLGVGIPGMRLRLERMGGHLRIKRLRAGTSLRAYIPLRQRKRQLPAAERAQQRAA